MITNLLGAIFIDLNFAYFGLVVTTYDKIKDQEDFVDFKSPDDSSQDFDISGAAINLIKKI